MTPTLSTPLHFLVISLTIFTILPTYDSSYLNYADALSKSILFFEGQRSGFLPGDQRISWRQNSGLSDGYAESVELTGGYYDAGDNVKFGFPMAFTTTMLAWSVVEFGDVMPPGELRNALVAVRWATDYLLKTVSIPDRIYVQDVRDDPPPKSVVGRSRLLDNYMQSQQTETNGNKTDLDNYLAEEPLNPMTTSFDILLWWKDNSIRYKTLSLIAKDVLAIPVSTVASESAFSTSGRILDPFRSSLSPRMLEVLVCTQSWLKERHDGKKSNEYVDDINSYEFLDEGDKNKTNIGASKEKLKGNVINVIDD